MWSSRSVATHNSHVVSFPSGEQHTYKCVYIMGKHFSIPLFSIQFKAGLEKKYGVVSITAAASRIARSSAKPLLSSRGGTIVNRIRFKKCTGTSDKLRRIDDTSPNSGRKIYYALLLAASLKSALILFFCLQVSLITIHDGFKRWYTFTTRLRFIMVESVLYVLLANDILMLNFFPVMLWVLKI